MQFELNGLIREVENSLRLIAGKRRVKIRKSVDPTLHTNFVGERYRIQQILLSIVASMLQFTDVGPILIRAKKVSASETFETVCFEVEDPRHSISPNDIPAVFQDICEADAMTVRKIGGAGLGITISRALVEIMGGQLGTMNTAQGGSIIWFALELKKAPKSDAPHLLKILVAEDDPILQKSTTKTLEKLGYSATAVSNGNEVIEALRQSHFDLVLMDIYMPEMDGIDATHHIRESIALGRKNIPIIALTGDTEKDARQFCIESGMNDYIAKPASIETLHAIIEKWLG